MMIEMKYIRACHLHLVHSLYLYLSSNSLNAIRCGEIVYQGAEECPDPSPVTTPVPTNGTVPADNSGNTSQNTTPEISSDEKSANELNQSDSEDYSNKSWPPILVGLFVPVIGFLIIVFYLKYSKKPPAETDIEGGAMQNLVE